MDGVRVALQAVNGTGLSGSPLVHGTAANLGWSVVNSEKGGLLLDLGQVYALDALQVWNFNELGLEGYGTQDFTLWVSSNTAQPTGTGQMTQVDGNVGTAGLQSFTLARMAAGDPTYWVRRTCSTGPRRGCCRRRWGTRTACGRWVRPT